MKDIPAIERGPETLLRRLCDASATVGGVVLAAVGYLLAIAVVRSEMNRERMLASIRTTAQTSGILILTVCEIGMIFPPVGLNVYIMSGLAKDVPMAETYKGVVPFLLADFVRLAPLIALPTLSLWLVNQLT